ncbi:unnamed protein product [Tilletia controversa]|uniref:SET domain-containing protein n=2 Tax=Tilletia TaxID=13289 RepID=A0A177VGS3_9BASI|nr:hypothetical protein CF336_g464 [Tilletia laevis]KAE8264513.1 hypothetical protein A4X03_0g889 [Tilletia caries]CAD6899832.1 unnamed protein product [Tilletia controversa]KAE8205838.1 hypothetical protein CF335_g2167 [Tilletia laevis]CAD6893557.1 unnamed protein product [Tilletia caries]
MVAPQDLSHDDDILSDILVDNLGSENCPISTHKMNGSYKSQRVHASLVRDLVWQQVIVEHNITGAVDQLCTMGIVKKYISNKDHRQLHAFKLHAKRYFEAYHPECGIEFVQSTRYSRASALLKQIAAAPPGSGAAGPSSTASTSAIPLAAEPSASASVSAPTASQNGPDVTAVSVKTESSGPADASNLIPVDRPAESMPMQGVTNTASEPTTQTTVNESADVVMTDAKATDSTPVPLAKTEAPVTNGVAAITEAIITQLTDANGPPKESNGQIAPSTGPTDAMSTGASTPTATSAVSKGKRRIPSESGSKGKSTLNAQLASSWSDAFGSLAKADMAVCAIKSYKEGDFIEFLKGGVKDLTREEDEAMKVEAAAARDRLGPGQIAATAAPARDFSVIRSAQKGCSQLLLGPARFVNHDCNPNVEFYRSGQSITFRCTRPIMPKDEITCYYGPNYFEWGNAECLCATCEANGKGAFSVLAGVKLAGASHVGSPDLATGAEADIPGYSPGPEGSTSSVHSAHGSEAGSNGAGTGRRSSARVALVQASGRSRRMTPGGVPFPSMSMAPTSVSRRPSPSAETNGSSTSAAEIDGVLGLGVSVSGSESSSHHNNNKVARVSCKTCHDPFEWQQTWFSAPRDCQRCVRHERIYRAPWPIRMAEVALEARRMHLDKQKKKKIHQERKAGDAESERATKKVKVSKKRSEPTPLRLDGVVLSASGGSKRSNGKGKEKASNNGTGISPAPSSSMTSSIDSLGMSSDSDSDLTELESSDEEDEGAGAASTSMMSTSMSTGAVIPSSASGRDFEREVEDADITLGGVGGVPAEAVLGRSVAGQGSEGLLPGAGQGGSGAPLLDPTPSLNVPTPAAAAAAGALSSSPSKALAFADHLSRYGPTGKAPRTTLDFQARRREKPEPPWLDQDRRRSLRTKKSRSSRKSSSAAAAAKSGDSRKRQRESTSASAARRPRSSRAEGEEGSSSSSSRESSPGGPPVLGKDANLQNLAGFWGATDSGRRIRRPVLAGGVTSLLERQRAESAAKRRAREREEAKSERRRKADRRRKSGGGSAGNSENAGGAVVRMEKAKEDVKPPASRSRRSESPVKAGHQSLDLVLATSKTGNKATTTAAGAASSLMSSRKSMEVLQPLRSSNRQALKRDRMLAAGDDEGDDDEEEEDAGDDGSDEDDDFDASDISSTDDELEEEQEQVGGGGGEEKAGDQQQQQQQQEGGGGAEMRPPSRSVGRPRSNGKRSRQPASSGDDDDDSCSDDSDGSVQGTSRSRRRRRRSSSSSSSPTNSKKKRFVFSRSSSPMPNIPGLATKGPERTSNANLALAWSGGVAEGAKRTRKPVVREPISIGQASASGSRRSPSMGAPPSSRGRSSETPKPSMSAGTGVGASVPRSHRPVELSRLRSTSDAGDQEQDRKRRSRTSPALSVSSAANAAVVATAGAGSGKGGGAPGRPAHLAGPGGMRSSSAAAAAGGMRLDGRAGVPTAGSGGRYPSSSHSHSSAHRVLSGPSMPGGPPGGGASRRYSSSSSSQPGSPNLMYNMLPSPANPPVPGFRRPASPAGTPLSLVPAGGVAGGGSGNGGSAGGAGGSSANRNAGAPRRNLRWGSGKVTHSRPSPHLVAGSLPPSGGGAGGSTSPIGGPTTGPGGAVLSSSSSSSTTTASFTTTRPPGVLGVKMDPGGLMRGGSGSPAGSPLMMSGGGLVGGGRALGPAPPSSGEGGAKRETGTPPALTAGASGTASGVVPR